MSVKIGQPAKNWYMDNPHNCFVLNTLLHTGQCTLCTVLYTVLNNVIYMRVYYQKAK